MDLLSVISRAYDSDNIAVAGGTVVGSSNTARRLIEGAIRLIKGNVYRPNNSDLGNGFISLNDLLSSWGSDQIMVPTVITENFPLVIDQLKYTIGSGGDFSTDRPIEFKEGVFIRDAGNMDHPVGIITRLMYRSLVVKDGTGRPTMMYYEPSYPMGTIYFNTAPVSIETVYFNTLKPLSEITNVNATLNLPPEYKRALRYNLALELAPEYDDIKLPSIVARIAEDSKDALERVNSLSQEEMASETILNNQIYSGGSFETG